MVIYKITNQINKKIYIGLTTNSVEERFRQHKMFAKTSNRRLYQAMRKYGVENFTIEIIDKSATTIEQLGNLERKYIYKYKSQDPNIGYNITAGGQTCSYDANPKAKLSLDEVIQIREIYAMAEMYCKECWEIYKNKISFSAFQKIWEGITWGGIMDDIYTKEAIEMHKYIYAHRACGEKNPYAKYTNTEILEIRKYYVTHSLEETYIKYGNKSKSIGGFRSTLTKSYINLPKYHKNKKIWTLKGKIIDINNYKPVSTISESGE